MTQVGFAQHDNVLLRSGCHAERSRSMTGDDIQWQYTCLRALQESIPTQRFKKQRKVIYPHTL
jgi:hypothetical protein